jgi:hypothetical protein
VLILAAFGLCLAACGGSSPKAAPHPATTTTTTAPQITSSTITLGGTEYPVPTEGGSRPIPSGNATGQQVILTAKGFLPRELFAPSHKPVVFTNLTDHTVTLTFEVTSQGPPATLAPGQSTSFVPRATQFTYQSSTHYGGIVVVGALTT